MRIFSAMRTAAQLVILLAASNPATSWAAMPATNELAVDLDPLIDQAVGKPDAFAVSIPRSVSPQSDGQWTRSADTLSWHYAVRIPNAVSMSFHAATAYLPESATLTVTAHGVRYGYSANDVRRGGLWSRVAQGDTLSFELRVAAADAARVRLAIDSFQAGYRSLKPGAPNHPRFEKIRRLALQGTQAAATSCVENFSCHVTTANQGPGQSTVALIISNQYQCSGVLLNDVPADGAPYVLTARHCEQGDPNGGAPGAAASVAVYWDATSPCGGALGSIYDPGVPVQSGATTVVEQQDAWLLLLDNRPAVADAYFAGWDATGAVFVGGYTPHHALGNDRQYAGWYGQAYYESVPAGSLGVGFDSTFWGTVNQVGSIGPGASGAGLFDASDRLVGTIVRGLNQGGTGVCPSIPPSVPNAGTSTALSTALAGIFTATSDPVSTTGAVTLQSVLDPAHTGTTILDGATQPPYIVSFQAGSAGVQDTGSVQSIYWYVANASRCTASGGLPGDGWSGALAITGIASITEYYAGTVSYGISCSNANRTIAAQIQITWVTGTPVVSIGQVSPGPVIGAPFQLQWNASLGPCVGTGAGSANGWNGAHVPSGSGSFVESAPGEYTYTLTCGSGSNIKSAQAVVTVSLPVVTITASGVTNVRIGQTVYLDWHTNAASPCIATGGAPGDGWAGSTIGYTVTESAPGIYTYGITCGTGSYAVAAQTQIVFTNDRPGVTLTLTPNYGTVATSANVSYTLITVSWVANVFPCNVSVSGPDPSADLPTWPYGNGPTGSPQDTRAVVGQYIYTVTCGSGSEIAQASAAATWTGSPSLYLSPIADTQVVGVRFGIQWQSNVAPCTRTGGQAGDGWSTATSGANWQGGLPIAGMQPGPVTYSISCGSGAASVQGSVSATMVAAPEVTFAASNGSVGSGNAVTLSWNSNTQATCVGTGGTAGDGWSGTAWPASGAVAVTEHVVGSVTFGIVCGAKSGSATVNYVAQLAPSLTENVSTAVVGAPIVISWSSSALSSCIATGGSASDGWTGTLAVSGSMTLTEQAPGTYTYGLNCGGAGQASTSVVFTASSINTPPTPLAVDLSSSAAAVQVGNAFTLTWNSTQANTCAASGGATGDGWAGAVATSGSMSVMESSSGSFTYSLTCTNATQRSAATVAVTVNAPTPGGSSSGGSGGGGGALNAFDFMLLALCGLLGRARMIWRYFT